MLTKEYNERLTMYIKNRGDSSKIKGYHSRQNLSLTEAWSFVIAYFSYTNR